MEKLKIHTIKNMIHVDDFKLFTDEQVLEVFDENALYTFDTESCDDDVTAWVYAWSIGNTNNDKQVYGEDLNDFYSVFNRIARAHNKKYKKGKTNETFKVFVHNLTWDFEFMKYSLLEMGFEMYFGEIKYWNGMIGKYKVGKLPPGCFEIVENKGDVYSAKIKLHDTISLQSTRKNKKGEYSTQEVEITIELIDTLKIMQKKLKEIATEVISIDEMFLKLDDYDYTTVRPKGHVLTDYEKMYLYNDVYILKEFIKQFYIGLETTKTTASSIAFEKFLQFAFDKNGVKTGKNKKSFTENYREFEEVYPNLTDYIEPNLMIRDSYEGGWTQANKKYVGEVVELNNAVSIDINSSYPAVVRYNMLPCGEPMLFDGYPIEKIRELGYDMELVTIEFDGYKNINEDDLIGHLKAGAVNKGAFADAGVKIKNNEYVSTNIIDGKCVGMNYRTKSGLRYRKTFWSFELANMLEYMTFYKEEYKINKLTRTKTVTGLVEGFDIVQTLAFKGEVGRFADAVDFYMEKKKQGKKEKNKCMTASAKLTLASFYGKMGSTSIRKDRSMKMDSNGKITFDSVVNTYYTNKKYYTAFASAVTAWGRVNLRTMLYKIGYNNVLYFDTDSLYTTLNEEQLRAVCGDSIDDYDLGKWDIEKTYNKFKTLGAKKYMLELNNGQIVCKCSGMPDDAKVLVTNMDDFVIGMPYRCLQKERIAGGYVLRERIKRIKDEDGEISAELEDFDE